MPKSKGSGWQCRDLDLAAVRTLPPRGSCSQLVMSLKAMANTIAL